MRSLSLLLLVLCLVSIEACSGASPTAKPNVPVTLDTARKATLPVTEPALVPMATPVPLTPQEEALWDRADAAFSASGGREWQAMYEYTSLRWRETCDSEGYAARVGGFVALIRGFMGIDEDARDTIILKLLPEKLQ